MQKITRCLWANPNNPRYLAYHDHEWGKPLHDDRMLFEMLVLEGAQAGLSWETVLNKRENYREAFDGFDVRRVAAYDEAKIDALLHNSGIIRNRRKIEAAIDNAKSYLQIQEEYGSFDRYIWGFVAGIPIVNDFKTIAEVPASTPLSEEISKALKRRGMRFVGPTILYAYMQAIGMVDDHLAECFCRHHSPPYTA